MKSLILEDVEDGLIHVTVDHNYFLFVKNELVAISVTSAGNDFVLRNTPASVLQKIMETWLTIPIALTSEEFYHQLNIIAKDING